MENTCLGLAVKWSNNKHLHVIYVATDSSDNSLTCLWLPRGRSENNKLSRKESIVFANDSYFSSQSNTICEVGHLNCLSKINWSSFGLI